MNNKLEPLVLIEDEPVPDYKTDELQLISYSRAIAGAAIGSKGPFTIGVFGDWGHGKTSVLKQAQSLIEAQKNSELITAWFNAWQFEREEHPIIPLIASIVREIEFKTANSRTQLNEKLKNNFKNTMNALRAIAYGFSAKSKIKIPALAEVQAGFVAKEMVAQFDELKTTKDPLLESSLYYNAFELLTSETDDQKKTKIVVFIDDLDRCLPPQALALLESIKLVLAQKGFIFVLAVDRKIIEGFLKKRYRDEFGLDDYEKIGVSYLDKIVQLPLSLPPHSSRFDKFITDLLKRDVFDSGANLSIKKALIKLKKSFINWFKLQSSLFN